MSTRTDLLVHPRPGPGRACLVVPLQERTAGLALAGVAAAAVADELEPADVHRATVAQSADRSPSEAVRTFRMAGAMSTTQSSAAADRDLLSRSADPSADRGWALSQPAAGSTPAQLVPAVTNA